MAFANTSGGVLLVGVQDRTRRVLGVPDPLTLEERLSNLISDRIRPRLVPGVEVLPWCRTQVLGAQIHPSSTRPHYLLDLRAASGCPGTENI